MSCASLLKKCGRLEIEVQGANLLETLADVLPVHELPEGLHPVPLHVRVLQVVGVLPHIEHEKRHGAVPDVALRVADFPAHESLPERLPRERAPSRALDRERGLAELALQVDD